MLTRCYRRPNSSDSTSRFVRPRTASRCHLSLTRKCLSRGHKKLLERGMQCLTQQLTGDRAASQESSFRRAAFDLSPFWKPGWAPELSHARSNSATAAVRRTPQIRDHEYTHPPNRSIRRTGHRNSMPPGKPSYSSGKSPAATQQTTCQYFLLGDAPSRSQERDVLVHSQSRNMTDVSSEAVFVGLRR